MAKYCVKCGKALPDGVEVCPDCNVAAEQEREAALFTHMTSDAEVWKAAEPVKQKPKRDRKLYRNAWLILAGALLVAAAVILILVGRPDARVVRALRSGDIDRALTIYWSTPRLYESEVRSEKIDAAIMDAAQKLCDQYANHELDADTAAGKLAQLGTFGDASAEMLADTYAEFRSFSGSQSRMGEADKLYTEGDFLEARKAYLLVLESDADYAAAQEKAGECLVRYGEQIAADAEARMEQNDYPGALALLKSGNETLSKDYGTFSDAIDALIPVCYDRYETYLLAEAKSLAALEDYEAADAKIRGALADFPAEREALTKAQKEYEELARQKRMRSAGELAEEAYASGDYAGAFKLLEDFQAQPDEDAGGVQLLIQQMEERFASECCGNAKETLDNNRDNLKDAIAVLDWGLEIRELDAIREYKELLETYLPLNLAEAEFAEKEGIIFRNPGEFQALNGKTYTEGWIWGENGATLTFLPDGAFDRLEGKFVTRRDDETEATGQFEVWCDGEKVFTSEELIHPQADGQTIVVEISGCKELKLVFLCDYEVSTAENGFCYHGLCNPSLTKNMDNVIEGEN